VTQERYLELRSEEVEKLMEARGAQGVGALDKAVELLDSLVTSPTYTEFLTIPGYRFLE
jgi:hypothetical protein